MSMRTRFLPAPQKPMGASTPRRRLRSCWPKQKARAVAHELEDEGVVDALVLGCDSVFEFEGTAYGKPYTPQKARERITAMSGKMGTLHTGALSSGSAARP